jgi:sulfur carrier protein ThiS
MTNITLIVIPGSGARQLSLDSNTTVAQLVCQENLHGRDIIINGSGIPTTQWETTVVPTNAEVFATGSVKGNINF